MKDIAYKLNNIHNIQSDLTYIISTNNIMIMDILNKYDIGLIPYINILNNKINNLRSCNKRIVFCHRDLNVKNIILDTTKSSDYSAINFIDWEYAGCDYYFIDIGLHLFELNHYKTNQYAQPDNSKEFIDLLPTDDFISKWLLMYYNNNNNNNNIDINYEIYCVKIGIVIACCFWSLWAINTLKNDPDRQFPKGDLSNKLLNYSIYSNVRINAVKLLIDSNYIELI